jgi:plasmid stabilization system protein ParE
MIVALELHITKRAARELNRIAEWWALNRPAAPGAVSEDLQAALALLIEQPNLGSLVPQASSTHVRRFHVDRIRYWVYYRVRGGRLEVVSVWHSSRGTSPAV